MKRNVQHYEFLPITDQRRSAPNCLFSIKVSVARTGIEGFCSLRYPNSF